MSPPVAASAAAAHTRRFQALCWKALRQIDTWHGGAKGPFILEVEALRALVKRDAGLPRSEGVAALRRFEDRLSDTTLWDTYAAPATPGRGTLFTRNPPHPTSRVKYILDYGRPGFSPIVGPSYRGWLAPGEEQWRPADPEYGEAGVEPDARGRPVLTAGRQRTGGLGSDGPPEPAQ